MVTREPLLNALTFSQKMRRLPQNLRCFDKLATKVVKFILPFKDLETVKTMILAVHLIKENDEKAQSSMFLEKLQTITSVWQLIARFATGLLIIRLFAEIQTKPSF